MKKEILVLAIILLSLQGFAQLNQASINYNLKVTGLENVGGDLSLIDTICPLIQENKQVIFEAQSQSTVSFDVNNRSGGNSCVTLVVETTNGIKKTIIPENSQSGVLKFSRVKKAYLSIQKRPNLSTTETFTSLGTVTIWF